MILGAEHDPQVWHRDPFAAERTGRPNDFLAAPEGTTVAAPDRLLGVWAEAPEALFARFEAIIVATDRVERLIKDDAALFATYVQRSALIGFPDYISVRVVPQGEGASLAIWSRARFGYSDFGVNRARVDTWLGQLGSPAE
ncbi:MAG: DUF1499 domain-containing protein [Pseudomonadota bacterium]